LRLTRELGKRLVGLVLVIFLVTLFTSLLVSWMPGDPVDTLIPLRDDSPGVVERKAELRSDLNLDRAFPVRYWGWVSDFFTGDFGSFFRVSGEDPVRDTVADSIPVSLQLMGYAQVIALVVAVPLAVAAAYKAGGRFDKTANTTAFGLLALPNYVVGLLLAFYVGVWLGWLPNTGYTPFGEDVVEHFRRMILPAVSLAAGLIAIYMRLLRSDMVQTLQEDFIQMARSKGLSDRRVLWRHALRPSSATLLTVVGLNVGFLISGAIVIERIFSIPGLGLRIFEAIQQRQIVALQSYVAIIAIFFVLVNFLVDVLHTFIDPRIRHARARG
jgi:peptide/nickel transport system permease protein